MIGQIVSHYRVIEKLGEGGMGIVYKAEDVTLKRFAALKFLPPDMTRDPAAKERFVLEAQAASALNHAHVTTIYGIEESPEGTFIAMEYVEGQTLKELISSDRTPTTVHTLPISHILDIAIQVAEGLAAAHEKGIVHRDIKADNIMLSVRGQAKIMDFGLAKLKGAEKLTQTRSTLGTLSYMSPEQAKGEEVDRRSDIFSLGVVLYEMLAGRLPFAGEYQAAVIYAIINEAQQPVARYNSHVSAELERIVDKAMAKDREERYQHADDLLADLRRERKSLEYVKAGNVIPEKAAAKPKRKMLLVALVTAAVAFLALLIFLFSPFKLRIAPRQNVQAAGNSLAIMYFENLQNPEDKNKTSQMITALLTTGLSDSPRYLQVVSSQRLYDILKILGKEGLKVIDKSVATEVARKAGVQWMVTGKILKEEPNIVLVSEISDAATGKILATQRVNGIIGEDLFAVVDKLSPQVVKALSLPEQAQKELGKPVAETTTHSRDAYRSYIEGVDCYYSVDWTEAEKHFKKTLEYDPAFAMAYYWLAMMKYQGTEYQSANKYITQAQKYSAKLTQKEKLYLQSMEATISGNYEQGIKSLKEIVDLYPKEKDAYFELGQILFLDLNKPAEAIRSLKAAIALDPFFKLAYNQLAYAYDNIGDFEKSLWAINQYIALAPGEPNPYDSRGELYAWNGQIDLAIASLKKALEIKPGFFFSLARLGYLHIFKKEYAKAESLFKELTSSNSQLNRVWGRSNLALIPLYQGKLKVALKVLEDGIAADELEDDYTYALAFKHFCKAKVHEERGNSELAIQEIRAGSEIYKKIKPGVPLIGRDWIVLLLAGNGKMAEAEAIVRALKKESEENKNVSDQYLEATGALALGKGDLKSARNDFEKGEADIFGKKNYLLAHIYLQLGLLDKAAAILEKALSRYDDPRIIHPIMAVKAYYLLGMVYEKSGWKDKAIEKYSEFLDIWKNADAGLPEVADARQRLAKLRKL